MKEHVISYSAEMIRARQAGRKTQTRRLCGNLEWIDTGGAVYMGKPVENYWRLRDRTGSFPFAEDRHMPYLLTLCPYGQPGDRLVVKEAAWMWCAKIIDRNRVTKKTGKPKVAWMECRNVQPIYCADHPEKPTHVPEGKMPKVGNVKYSWHKKNARFLPRWASRGLDEVVSIRVERVQDISEADAVAEGISMDAEAMAASMSTHPASLAYSALWESIHGPGSWERNDWVWVVEFKILS